MNKYHYMGFLILITFIKIFLMNNGKYLGGEDVAFVLVAHIFVLPSLFMYFYSKSIKREVEDIRISEAIGKQFEQNWNIMGRYDNGTVENFTPEHKDNKGPHVSIEFYRRQARECAKNGEFEKAALNIEEILDSGMRNNWDLKMSYVVEMVDYYLADKNETKAMDSLFDFLGAAYHPNISIKDPMNMMQAYESLYKINEMQLNFKRGLEYRLKVIYYTARVYLKNKEKDDLKEYASTNNISRILSGNSFFDNMDEQAKAVFLKEISQRIKLKKTKCEEVSFDIVEFFFTDIAS